MTHLNPFERTVLILLAVLFVCEFRNRQFVRSWYVDKKRLRRNLSFAVAAVVVMMMLKSINAVVQTTFAAQWLRIWFPVDLFLCFLVAELLGWGLHFLKHKNSFLWNFHFQHHRESQYNLWLAAHTHGLEVLVSGVATACVLSVMGFSVMTVEIYLGFYAVMKFFQHSAHPYSLGLLDKVLITPSYHRLHHEVNSRCNYGVTLTLFDVLFGTTKWPTVPLSTGKLGLSPDCALPYGFWKEMIHFHFARTTNQTHSQVPSGVRLETGSLHRKKCGGHQNY